MSSESVSDRSIVHVTLWDSPYLGNFMSNELALARAIREQLGLGSHFVLAIGEGRPAWLAELERAGVTWSVLPPSRRDWRAHLDGVLAQHSAALVHSHFTAADLVAAGAARAANIPCVWHLHTGFDGYPPSKRLTDLLKMRIIARRRVARIVAVSPWLADFAVRRGVPAEKVQTLPNPINFQRFERLPDRAAACDRFGLHADAQVVLGFGWWPEVKGVDVLLDAVAGLALRRDPPSVLLVGEQRMRTFISERYEQRPAWLHEEGFVDDAAWLFAAADVFVSASRHEGQSATIGEAAACGLQIVMSDIEGTAGWAAAPFVSTFQREDALGLAKTLERLLDTTAQQRATEGAANREWVREQMGVAAWCEQICAIYEPLL
jgi:glycosyltransferase involved in cell wall biosynthesis